MWKYLFFFFASLSASVLEIGGARVQVEIAEDPGSRQVGLSGRRELSENCGMLFIYERPQIVSFWMKETLIPLSVGFFDAEQVLFQIEDMNPPGQGCHKLPTYKSKRAALYALEVAQGWFTRNKITPGMKFSLTENPSTDRINPIK